MPAYQAGSPRMAAPIWKRKRPKSLGKPVPLTPKQKAAAKAMAQAAGRPYPNLVDNIAASRLKNPIMPTIYTVKSEHLIADAERIEHDANESLNAWILLGQSEKYSEAMKTADVLRRAAASKNMTTRREILRNAGFTVKTPKQVTSPPEGEPRKENPTMKKPTPAQLAARARFAEMARSGAFKKKAAKARKAKANPAKKTVSQKISQLTREGYPQKQAVAIALSEERAGKVKRNPVDAVTVDLTDQRYGETRVFNTEFMVYKGDIDPGYFVYGREKNGVIKVVAYPAGPRVKRPKISRLVQPGFKTKAEAMRVAEMLALEHGVGLKKNPATGEKRSRTKLNPVKYRDMAQNLRTDSKVAYAVHFPDRPSYHAIAYYSKKADAMEVAQETSDRIGKPLAVSRVQIYFGQE